MDIKKYPQFHLHQLTLRLLELKQQLLPENCDMRCVNSTIINKAYYSSFLFCELWLDYEKKFKPLKPWEFDDEDEKISEHKQIRNALYNFDEDKMGSKLNDLFKLRRKADYDPFMDISQNEVEDAIKYMKTIFNNLKFN